MAFLLACGGRHGTNDGKPQLKNKGVQKSRRTQGGTGERLRYPVLARFFA
jgi:hypothetical protein